MEPQPPPQISSVFGAIAAPQADEVVYHGTLQKQKKTPGIFNKLPRWGERGASIKIKLQYTGYGAGVRKIYYLTWTSETDPTGERNMIEFQRMEEVKLKALGDEGYQFKITMIPDESEETKEYWFKSVDDSAEEWVRHIGQAVKATRYNLTPAVAGWGGTMIRLTQYDGGTELWNRIMGAPCNNIKQGQGGGRRKKKRTKRKTKKRKPRTKRKTKKRKTRTKRRSRR